jgi:phosphohistidine phosphatase
MSSIEHVLVSPYVRTQQTLNMALPFMPLVSSEHCDVCEFLNPGGDPQRVIEWLSANNPRSILLVTHQPLIGTLLDEICGFESGRYRMGTGALAAVKLDVVAKGLGELKWLRQAQS